jgi:hypothetical protein
MCLAGMAKTGDIEFLDLVGETKRAEGTELKGVSN